MFVYQKHHNSKTAHNGPKNITEGRISEHSQQEMPTSTEKNRRPTVHKPENGQVLRKTIWVFGVASLSSRVSSVGGRGGMLVQSLQSNENRELLPRKKPRGIKVYIQFYRVVDLTPTKNSNKVMNPYLRKEENWILSLKWDKAGNNLESKLQRARTKEQEIRFNLVIDMRD